MGRGLRHLVSIALLCALASPRAWAAGESAAAEAMFREGRRLMDQARYQEACGKFEASHRLDPSFGALMNMGDCYLKLDRTASAWAAYREGGDLARKQGDRNRARMADARSAPLEPRLARLVIVVSGEQEAGSFEVRKDGKRVDPAMLGTPIPVDPGEYDIEAEGRDVEVWRSRVKVATPGTQVTERITLRPVTRAPVATVAVAAPAPAEPSPAEPSEEVGVAMAAPRRRGLVLMAGSGFGYQSTSSGEIDASVHGLTVEARVTAGYVVGRIVAFGGLALARALSPTLTFQGREASGDLSMSSISLAAGVGVRAAPEWLLGATVRLTKVEVSTDVGSLSSSFGPGFEAMARRDVYQNGRWTLSLEASAGLAALDVEGTAWTAVNVGLGLAGSYQ